MNRINVFLGIILVLYMCSCSDFLDAKSDKSMTVPNRLSDLQAILNHANSMNSEYVVALGEVASDNLYLTDAVFNAILGEEDRAAYIWKKIPVSDKFWVNAYGRILNSNVVLQQLDEISEGSREDRDHIKGAALFYRGASFFDLLQVYSRSYEEGLSDAEPGIVLRMTGHIDEQLYRAEQAQCMQQIEDDLLQAAELLRNQFPRYPTQASKTAAYGFLSRYYLMKKDYTKALYYAEQSLSMRAELIDYNGIPNGKYRFERYNEEVLFFIRSDGTGVLSESRARVHPDLYAMYSDMDRRKTLFFTRNADGFQAFSGDYSKSTASYKFCGLTTAEMLLTRAECHVRLGNMENAKEDMRRFLANRYSEDWVNFSEMDKGNLLRLVLDERRKELVFRGVRWFDLRRLSSEESGVDRIVRTVNGVEYTLSIEEIKAFRFLIPQSVIDETGMTP